MATIPSFQSMFTPCSKLQIPLPILNTRKLGHDCRLPIDFFQQLEDSRLEEGPSGNAYCPLRVLGSRAKDPVDSVREMSQGKLPPVDHSQENDRVAIIDNLLSTKEPIDAGGVLPVAEWEDLELQRSDSVELISFPIIVEERDRI